METETTPDTSARDALTKYVRWLQDEKIRSRRLTQTEDSILTDARQVLKAGTETGTVPVPVRTLWAAYTGSAAGGNDISLHRTEREALEACFFALVLEEDDDSEAPVATIDDDELRDRLDELCSGASDWAVCEVPLP